MSELKKSRPGIALPLAIGATGSIAAGRNSVGQASEIDSHDRATASESEEAALVFLEEFRSGRVAGDLIELLRPEVAGKVCNSLPNCVSRARGACGQVREAPAAKAAADSGDHTDGTEQPARATVAAESSSVPRRTARRPWMGRAPCRGPWLRNRERSHSARRLPGRQTRRGKARPLASCCCWDCPSKEARIIHNIMISSTPCNECFVAGY